MAVEEYQDLYNLAQEKEDSKYHLISFDVVNSKELDDDSRSILQDNIKLITKEVYEYLLKKEEKLGRNILIKDEMFSTPWEIKDNLIDANYLDPFIMGDNFQFTIIRNSINKEELISLVYEKMKMMNMPYEFHLSDAYYETNDYNESNNKLFRSYCLKILENSHKTKENKIK